MEYIPHFDSASVLLANQTSGSIENQYIRQNDYLALENKNSQTHYPFVLNSFALNATITVEIDMTMAPAAGGNKNRKNGYKMPAAKGMAGAL